jgi:spermidine/putrescine transport system permease protein
VKAGGEGTVRKTTRFGGTLFVALVLLFMYLPVVMMVLFSFNDGEFARFEGFSLRWYGELLRDRDLIDSFWNSVTLAVISCLSAAVIGTLGAVGMAKSHFRLQGALESASAIPIMLPEIVLGMAFMAFFSLLGVRFGMMTLVIAHTTFCVPYIYINVKSRLAGLDKSIVEAGMDLGAGPMRAFFDITLPLIAPAVLSGSLLAFAMSMDDVVISFFVIGATFNTMPIKVYSMIKVGVTPQINALCTIMLGIVFLCIGIFRLVSSKGKKPAK